jgi:hypothetical protein
MAEERPLLPCRRGNTGERCLDVSVLKLKADAAQRQVPPGM